MVIMYAMVLFTEFCFALHVKGLEDADDGLKQNKTRKHL